MIYDHTTTLVSITASGYTFIAQDNRNRRPTAISLHGPREDSPAIGPCIDTRVPLKPIVERLVHPYESDRVLCSCMLPDDRVTWGSKYDFVWRYISRPCISRVC
jgi:hypothetical protein